MASITTAMPAARPVASSAASIARASVDGAATTAAQRIVSEIVSDASCTDPLAHVNVANARSMAQPVANVVFRLALDKMAR